MQKNTSNNRNWIKLTAVLAAVVLVLMYTLSTLHYRTLVLNPVWAWHGANLSVRSILGITNKNDDLPANMAAIKRVAEKIKTGELSYQNISTVTKQERDSELEERVANNQQRIAQLKADQQALQTTKERLLDAKRNTNSLNQDLISIAAYEQDQRAQQQAADNAIAQTDEPPTQEEVNALLAKRGQTNQTGRSVVPVEVLNNVQRTTGISADEVNELLNRE